MWGQISFILFNVVLVLLNLLPSPVEGLSLDEVHGLIDCLAPSRPQSAAGPEHGNDNDDDNDYDDDYDDDNDNDDDNDDVSPLSSRTVGEAGVCWGEVEVQILDGVVC